MKRKAKKFVKVAAAVIFTAACFISLYAPFPSRISGGETYDCVWEDGTVTEESFSSAYTSLAGMDGESVILSRDGLTGKIESGAKMAFGILDRGSLSELLGCKAEGTRIDGAALYRIFSNRVWYSGGEYYVWTGNRIKRVSRAECNEIVFLDGRVTSRILKETGVSTVYLRAGAEISASAFIGSAVKKVYAEAPYTESEGAIYINTVSGKRLLASVGGVKELKLDDDLAFTDEGALLACTQITSLTLPFLGSAKSPYGTAYTGELAHLFSDGKEYRVPETLTRVTVTGGRIVSFAFYACPNLKEINACTVQKGEISKTAFSGLDSLGILHTPKKDVTLTGDFTSYTAECGCTVYIRK